MEWAAGAVAGLVVGAVVVWRWRRRPLELDVTIRHRNEETHRDS